MFREYAEHEDNKRQQICELFPALLVHPYLSNTVFYGYCMSKKSVIAVFKKYQEQSTKASKL